MAADSPRTKDAPPQQGRAFPKVHPDGHAWWADMSNMSNVSNFQLEPCDAGSNRPLNGSPHEMCNAPRAAPQDWEA